MGCNSSKEDTTAQKSNLAQPARISMPPLPVCFAEPGTAIIQNAQPILTRIVSNGPTLFRAAIATSQAVVTTRPVHHLKNVFAAPLDDIHAFHAPDFPKSLEEKKFLRQALQANFLFSALSERELRTIVDAFEFISVQNKETIIQQGDVGDFFYVIRKGEVKYVVDGTVVGHAGEGKSFGELSLLYTSPRAATVVTETTAHLYRVDQKTFRYILHSQTLQAESDKKDLVLGVPFLKELDLTDISRLVHTMTTQVFKPGDYIVRKGASGDTFYVIQEGKVRVTDITIGSTDYEDQTLGPGEYFGERALATKEPRAANCIAKTKVVTLAVDRETFETVVGPLDLLTTKSEDRRKLVRLRLVGLYNRRTLGFSRSHCKIGLITSVGYPVVPDD